MKKHECNTEDANNNKLLLTRGNSANISSYNVVAPFDEGYWYLEISNKDVFMLIKFCPFCGKRL